MRGESTTKTGSAKFCTYRKPGGFTDRKHRSMDERRREGAQQRESTVRHKGQRWISKRKREWKQRKKTAAEMSQHCMSRIRHCSAKCRQWTQQHLSSDTYWVRVFESIIFYLLSFVESVFIVALLCFFYFRYGFRL
ncbi:uncharacterized protein A4U43_C01F35940 [Asparagus officinalis]|uniref:Uncharacterized protein n=1 Tax=Asparagus officinalis TaxID=4686 RepID=A0A5P1FW61_ASPOF|nr:uncharacterized protein A4U43_C01F35940 [Asparagus officinalis]